MIRDRLEELKANKNELDTEVEVMVEVTADQAAMERFFSQIEEVLEGISKIEASVAELRKKHNEMLTASHTDPELKKELDDLMADIKRSGAKVNKQLKELAPNTDTEGETHTADARIRRTQHSGATRRFVEAMTQYHHVQEEYRDKCKGRIHRQLKITGRDPTEDELDEMLEKGNVEIFTHGIMTETIQARQQLADIEARHEEIMKLENSLRELHDLFIDMAVLVQSQGEMVDNIATHVSSAQEYVEQAREQTGEALQYQGKARKKMIILGAIIGVVLLIIVLVIVLSI